MNSISDRLSTRLGVSAVVLGGIGCCLPVAEAAARAGDLEMIVVTAQKRPQALEDVPIALTVIDAGTLSRSRSRTLDELQGLVPNFQLDRSGFDSLTMRGIGGGGRNIGFDTRVGLYLDGVYIGQAQALGMPLLDIERVEMLKGPQGHLFGRNTVAGAINLLSAAPAESPGGELRGIYGNYAARELHGLITGPLAPGLGGRLAASWEARDGYTRNLADGQRLDDLERASSRASLVWEAADRLRFSLYGDYSYTRQDAIVGEPVTDFFDTPWPEGQLPPRQVSFNTTPFTRAKLYGGRLTADYLAAAGQTLTVINGYRGIRHRRQNDTDYSPRDLLRINFDDDFSQWSQELRIASSPEQSLRYVAGLYYLYEEADSSRLATIGQETDTVVPLPASAPVPSAPFGSAFGLQPGAVISSLATVRTSSLAAFSALDADLGSRLTLNLGARWTSERKRLSYDLDGSDSGGFQIGTLEDFRGTRRDSKLNLTAGLAYRVSDSTNIYAKYADGFKSGGWNIDFLNSAQVAAGFDFATETVESLELGIKGIAESGRLRWSAAIFNDRFDDFQVFQFVASPGGATVLQLRNAARVSTRGLDLSASLKVTDDLRLGGSYGLARARFNSFPGGGAGGADLSGTRVPLVSRHSAALVADYGRPVPAVHGRLDLFVEFSYRDGYLPQSTADPAAPLTGSNRLVNLRLSWVHQAERFGGSLWSRNLFDADYLRREARDFLGNQYIRRGEPRTYGLELWSAF